MLQAVFYGKCPDQDYLDHWMLFSVNLASPVSIESCPCHRGSAVLEEPLKQGWTDSTDADRGYSFQEPAMQEELVP
jgi:hypothetical protein